MLDHWNCQRCKGYNDILNAYCIFCKTDKPEYVTEYYQALVEVRRGIFIQRIVSYRQSDTEGDKTLTEEEELFVDLYKPAKISVAGLSYEELKEHREKLQKVAFEAKVHLQAASDELRERNAKKSSKQKEWLVTTDNDDVTSDAINAVKTRSARMSKMDKLRKQLLTTLDKETVDEMIRNLEAKATEKNVKTITFNNGKKKAEPVKVVVQKEAVTPFDPSKLKFGSK